jgi:hypothetical protein
MIATNGRVLFLSRQWVFSMCVASHEEAFYLEDLQVGVCRSVTPKLS